MSNTMIDVSSTGFGRTPTVDPSLVMSLLTSTFTIKVDARGQMTPLNTSVHHDDIMSFTTEGPLFVTVRSMTTGVGDTELFDMALSVDGASSTFALDRRKTVSFPVKYDPTVRGEASFTLSFSSSFWGG